MIGASLLNPTVLAVTGGSETPDAVPSADAATKRTARAAFAAFVIALATVAGIAVFLGFSPVTSVITGVVSGLLAGGLLQAAARRAASFHEPAADPESADDDKRGLR